MDFKNITLYPELIQDALLYILAAVIICIVSKLIFDWKEKRRLKKEVAEFLQRKEDEGREE